MRPYPVKVTSSPASSSDGVSSISTHCITAPGPVDHDIPRVTLPLAGAVHVALVSTLLVHPPPCPCQCTVKHRAGRRKGNRSPNRKQENGHELYTSQSRLVPEPCRSDTSVATPRRMLGTGVASRSRSKVGRGRDDLEPQHPPDCDSDCDSR